MSVFAVLDMTANPEGADIRDLIVLLFAMILTSIVGIGAGALDFPCAGSGCPAVGYQTYSGNGFFTILFFGLFGLDTLFAFVSIFPIMRRLVEKRGYRGGPIPMLLGTIVSAVAILSGGNAVLALSNQTGTTGPAGGFLSTYAGVTQASEAIVLALASLVVLAVVLSLQKRGRGSTIRF